MRIGGKKTWITLGLLVVLGFVGWETGWYVWGRYHYRAAEEAIEQRKFDVAEAHLRKYLGAWPDDVPFRLLAAQTARRRGDFEEAFAHLRLCKRNHKQFQEVLALENKLLRVQQGDLSEGDWLLSFCIDYPEAPETPLVLEAYLEGSLKLLKKLAPAATADAKAEMGIDRRHIGRALQAVAQWLKDRPGTADQVQGYFWRARLRVHALDFDHAVEDCRQGLELDPEHFELRLLLSTMLAPGSPQEAVTHLETLRQRDPNSYRVRLTLARLRRALGQHQQAGDLLDELIKADPDDDRVQLELGKVALDKRDFAESERWLKKVLARTPDDPQVHLALSQCLQGAGKPADAKVHQERFEQINAALQRQRDEMLKQLKAGEGK